MATSLVPFRRARHMHLAGAVGTGSVPTMLAPLPSGGFRLRNPGGCRPCISQCDTTRGWRQVYSAHRAERYQVARENRGKESPPDEWLRWGSSRVGTVGYGSRRTPSQVPSLRGLSLFRLITGMFGNAKQVKWNGQKKCLSRVRCFWGSGPVVDKITAAPFGYKGQLLASIDKQAKLR